MGVVEKDQAITVALGVIATQSFGDQMSFKGGTALRKAYFGDYRFSEDLDFTVSADVSGKLARIGPLLREAGKPAQVEFVKIEKSPSRPNARRLRIRYTDMNGHPNSIWIELSLRERVRLKTELRAIHDPYGVLATDVRVRTMALGEILAEKVRTVYARSEPRDLYDLWMLVRKGLHFDLRLINVKLKIRQSGIRFEMNEFERRIMKMEETWDRDLGPLVPQVPPFRPAALSVIAVARTHLAS